MTRHLFTSALIAGTAAGILAALLQLTFLVPLLLEGELYETGARLHFSVTGNPQSDAGHPAVWDQPTRHLGTLAMNIVTFTGFAFLMVVGFAIADQFGNRTDARRGAIWGLGAFFAVQLAPAYGLPPELPGTIGPDVAARQIWWMGCVAATLGGIGLVAFGRGALMIGGGIVLIALPHLIGAPTLDTYFGVSAPELAAHFVSRSLGVGAVTWVMLGLMAGALWARRD